MKIKISADSTCDLSPELIERYHIGITPLYIIRGEETLRDGIDVRPEELYEYANATGKLCKTAAVNVSDYLAHFAACREEYDAVIHFTISSDMSACYQNACIAAQEFTNVYPVDSRNLSTAASATLPGARRGRDGRAGHGRGRHRICAGEKAREARCQLRDRHAGVSQARRPLLGARGHERQPPAPQAVHRGQGRQDGRRPQVPRQALEKCYVQYIEERLKGRDDIDCHRIFITDSGCDEATWRELERVVRACQPFEEVIHTRAGCTVSNHCGPGCMGILYYHK